VLHIDRTVRWKGKLLGNYGVHKDCMPVQLANLPVGGWREPTGIRPEQASVEQKFGIRPHPEVNIFIFFTEKPTSAQCLSFNYE